MERVRRRGDKRKEVKEIVLNEVDRNLLAYERMKVELLRAHYGKMAVFCDGKLVAIASSLKEGVKKARKVSKGKELFIKELFKPEEQTKAILSNLSI